MGDSNTFEEYRNYVFSNCHGHHNESAYALVAVAFSVLACIFYPLLTDNTAYNKTTVSTVLPALRVMASRMRFGAIPRPFADTVVSGREGNVSKGFFGLRHSTGLKSIGTHTLRRGLGGIGSSGKTPQIFAPPGLGNWDNSCYQNSVIQGLASLRSLPVFLARVSTAILQQDSTNTALLDTVQKLNDPEYNGKQLWLPPTLKSMSTWQQQDAQEYFSKILDQLDKEAIMASQKASYTCYTLDAEKTANVVTESTVPYTPLLQNPLEGMLAQRVGCTICGHSDGISLIPFNCLTVPLGHDELYDIRDCLDEYTNLEEIEGVQCPKCTLLQVKGKLEGMMAMATSDAAKALIERRLQTVLVTLEEEDYSDNAITKKCQIPKRQWAASTKTKQAAIARAPKALIIHINRSIFNEHTGAQLKNPAAVQFPSNFEMTNWVLGNNSDSTISDGSTELWSMDPKKSMLPEHSPDIQKPSKSPSSAQYELRAVVTHFGRHENGHYVAYRKHRCESQAPETLLDEGSEQEDGGDWWRLSDDDVAQVQQDFVLQQGGVFMLFYERIDDLFPISAVKLEPNSYVPDESALDDANPVRSNPIEVSERAVLDNYVGALETPTADGECNEMSTTRFLPTLDVQRRDQPQQSSTSPGSASRSHSECFPEDASANTFHFSGEKPKAIVMRTSSVFHGDRASEDSLRSPRMVSAL